MLLKWLLTLTLTLVLVPILILTWLRRRKSRKLMRAIYADKPEEVKRLLAEGASLTDGCSEWPGLTPLDLACSWERLDIIPILLDHGASPAPRFTRTTRPPYWRTEDPLPRLVLHNDNPGVLPVVKLLLQHGADPLGTGPNTLTLAEWWLAPDIRRCLVNFVWEQLQQGRRLWRSDIELYGSIYAAARCGEGEALLFFLRQAIHRGFRVGHCDHADFIRLLQVSPPDLATLVIQELLPTNTVNMTDMLWRAVKHVNTKAVCALLPCADRQPPFEELVEVHVDLGKTQGLTVGPCQVLQLIRDIAYRPNATHSTSQGWDQAEVLCYLIEGGMVPSIYPVATVQYAASDSIHDLSPTLSWRTVHNYNPLAEDAILLLQKLPREVRVMVEQPAWSCLEHRKFPHAFQAAVRAFLLASATSARRRKQEQQQQELDGVARAEMEQAGCCLADLPVPLLERVLGLAAYPLSAWLALMKPDALM